MTSLTPKLLLAFALLSRTATAQDWNMPWSDPRDRPGRVDVSVLAGSVLPTDWSDLVLLGSVSGSSGIQEQVLIRDLRVEPASLFEGAVTYWKAQYGVRVQAGRSRSSLVSRPDVPQVDVATWFYDVRGVIGMREYTPQQWVIPYGFVGLGGITYDLSRTVGPVLFTFIERPPVSAGTTEHTVVFEDGRQLLLAAGELGLETVFAVNIGVGTDFRIPLGSAAVGLRLEVADHIAPSPVRLDVHELSRFGVTPATTTVRFGPVHHLRANVGFVLQLGR